MLKIPKKYSLYISLTLCVVFFAACVAGAFIMPVLSEMLVNTKDNIGNRGDITAEGRVFVLFLAYMILAVVVAADSMLFVLLLRVRKGMVFTSASTELVRGISWCCFLLGAVFAALGIYFQLAFILAFAALFLGICLRVVKNVLEEATEIKEENDLTV
ncbi:MAG: DUF2975 domain-containing protein [Clostridia bacterium]|nr:DUF2975 domain-containing protein [Clostridia bacterium]MBQ9746208.1 DUF2975 domain-containing protein [Clostridia bacterium]